MISLLSSSMFSYPKEKARKNEDSIFPPQRAGDGFLLAVADGVGSYIGASQASQAAIDVLSAVPYEHWDKGESISIFEEIKSRIAELSYTDRIFSDAATTLTFCHIGSHGLRVGHIGDCRAYIRAGNRLKQLTTDHTQHQRLVDEGIYKPSELKLLTGKNTLYSAISKKLELHFQDIYIPYEELETEDNTFEILVMSDGAYRFWDIRPRFAMSTLLDPSRFASSLYRRIIRHSPVDDHSLIAAKFHIDRS